MTTVEAFFFAFVGDRAMFTNGFIPPRILVTCFFVNNVFWF
jgi:hypothetical protein